MEQVTIINNILTINNAKVEQGLYAKYIKCVGVAWLNKCKMRVFHTYGFIIPVLNHVMSTPLTYVSLAVTGEMVSLKTALGIGDR